MRMGTMLMILALAGTWMAQGPGAKTPAERPELTPRRAECGILMPEREENHDVARLVQQTNSLTVSGTASRNIWLRRGKIWKMGKSSWAIRAHTLATRQGESILRWISRRLSSLPTDAASPFCK